ncbi:MAG: TonB-dependent receptor [Flavisolibacter sp.]|nr:TonB-dependent receptor [Flavisolibacter sp.]
MKKFVLILGFLLPLLIALAQSKVITGKITDEAGNPVQNASVTVRETNVGTTTDAGGNFSLTADARARTIVISYIGKGTQEIRIENRDVIDVTLRPADQSMQEVVVVAYGTQRREAVTSSVAQVSAKQLENRPVTNVISALAGVAPGITTSTPSGQPGSSPNVSIRGFGSLSATNTPLYVVDGVPFDYDISNINPDDIESVSILKDAAASSLYGSRAANGVIQVTTKKGRRDRTQIQASIAQGVITRGIPEYERIDAFQYYPVMWEAYRNSLVYPASATTAAIPIDSASVIASGLLPRNAAGLQTFRGRTYSDITQLLAYNPFNVPRTQVMLPNGTLNPNAQLLYSDDLDWLKDIQRNGSRGDYTLSISGGAPKSDYYISLGYTDEKGYVQNSDYKRYSARLNVNTQPLNWFRTGINLAGVVTQANQGARGGEDDITALVNPFYTNRIIGPIYPVYAHDQTTGNYILDQNGNRIYDIGSMANLGLPNRPTITGRHAIYETILNENLLRRNVLNTRLFGEITFLRNFRFTTNVTADISNSLRSQFENKIVGDGAPNGRSRRNSYDNLTMTINQLLNFSKTFGAHSIEALVGHETFDATYRSLENLKTGQVFEGNTELSNFTTPSRLDSWKDKRRIESYLSRANYSYNNRYFLSGSIRRDGSSRFSPDYRWGTFWSVGASWRIDQESFMNNIGWVSALRLRSAYGTVGNEDILYSNGLSNYYAYQAFFDLGFANNTEAGAAQSRTGSNPQLLWEVNKQFDVALEFGLFKNRLTGTFEYFDRRSEELLFRVTPPVSSGFRSINQNVGKMYNKGFEISLNGDVIRGRDFVWNLGTNWTTFDNKITRMPPTLPEIITSTNDVNLHKWTVGVSRYEYWLREYMGVDPTDGAALYRSNTWNSATSRVLPKGDTVTIDQNNARYHYAGNAMPDFFGSVQSSLSYKGLGLSFQINYSVGGKFYDLGYAQLMHTGTYGVALHKDILNRWQKQGDVTNVPRMDAGRNAAFAAASDRWLTDASFVNIQNVILSYTLPKTLVDRAHLQNVRVYVGGENLYLFTKRQGMNPTQNFAGLASNVYIPSRTITAGLNLTL